MPQKGKGKAKPFGRGRDGKARRPFWQYSGFNFLFNSYRRQNCLNKNSLISIIIPTKGSKINGYAKFSPLYQKRNCLTLVTAKLSGLPRNTVHGFHIHTYGDLSSEDGTATGGHYDPHNVTHALPVKRNRHVGDMGNIVANSKGDANYRKVFDIVKLEEIVGRGVIVHRDRDDGGQPTGNAGARVAQGVIGIANPEKK